MEANKDVNKRRNIFEIVSDLARYEGDPEASEAPASVTVLPAASRVVPLKPRLATDAAPPVPQDGPHAELAQMLADAQARAASQRAAAEALLQEAHELECRLADEAARARAANEQALARELATRLDEARTAEREAIEADLGCSRDLETSTAQRKQAESRHAELLSAHRTAADALEEARRALEAAEAACIESDRRRIEAATAEESARAEAANAAEHVTARRRARQEIEQQLEAIAQRAAESPVSVPSLESVEQLRALEARSLEQRRAADAELRIAQRRAADAQRNLVP